MKSKIYIICILSLLIASNLNIVERASSAPPPEEHTKFIYSEDSVFISEFEPAKNFNSDSKRYYLDVGEDEFTYNFVSYVRFDLTEIPSDAEIQSATISLYLSSSPENIPVKMFKVREAWDESTVTWNTKPSYKDFTKTQGLIDSITVSSTGRNYWNATSIVENWLDGIYLNYGVAFESNGNNFHRFSSDETTYYRPLLTVIYLSGSGSSDPPPEEPPEDSEPCEIFYSISPESPQSGDSVTLTASATDNLGLEYLVIKEGSIELCSSYAPDNETTFLSCYHTEVLYTPGKTFIIEANDKGGSPTQSITLPISVEGSGSAPEIEINIDYDDINTVPEFYSLLPGDGQTVNVTATATDPDGINYFTITVNGDLNDFYIDPGSTTVTRTVSVVNDNPSLDVFRYSAAARDMEGIYNSTSGEDIEIHAPFQWYWGLNFSNWGCDKNHTWSWEMMESIFGDSEIYLDKSRGWKKDWAWRLYDSKVKRGGRGGQCFGMCTTALELAHAPARITAIEIQDNATNIDGLEQMNWNTTWRYYYARQCGQYSDEVIPRRVAQYLDLYFTDWAASGWTGIHPYLDDLIDTIEDDLEDGKYGILSIRGDGKGHAVIPWRIVHGEDVEDIIRIYIYDPNHAHVSYHHEIDYTIFDYYPYIECNVNSKYSDWWIYQWNSTSTWQDEICYFSYEEAIGDASELNYIDSTDITDHDIPPGISYLVAIGSFDSTFYAEDIDGNKTGIVDGEVVSEIPYSVPLIDLESTVSPDNLMIILPENKELSFYFESEQETSEYTFSLNNRNSTYSLINKTISDEEEKITLKPKESKGDYVLWLSGKGDEEYSIKITKEYNDSQGKEIAREYTVYKNSKNEKENLKIEVSEDKEGLIIKNNKEHRVRYDFEFKSTEALGVLEYIPSSIGSVNLTSDQEYIVKPDDWQTTEAQASITSGKVQTEIKKENTPGFELSLIFICLVLILLGNKKIIF